MKDEVNHPKHYTDHPSGIECIEVTRHMNFNVGNAVKYCWRAGLKLYQDKNAIQSFITDLEKAVWYLQDQIKQLKGELENHDKQLTLNIEDTRYKRVAIENVNFYCETCGTTEPQRCICHKQLRSVDD